MASTAPAKAPARRRVLSIDIGRTHYAMCCMDFLGPDTLPRLVDLRLVQLGEGNAVPMTAMVDRMIGMLGTYEYARVHAQAQEPALDTVLIEQQMRAAPQNLVLAFSTYTFFRTQGVTVKMVRPSEKFQGWKHWCHDVLVPDFGESGKSYAQRKKASVDLAQILLDRVCGQKLQDFVTAGQKLDDVADAFLQSFCVV